MQWLAAWHRYLKAALAAGHFAWSHAAQYVDLLGKLADSSAAVAVSFLGSPPILYDEMLRKQVARCAQHRDPDLDLDKAFRQTDDDLMKACMVRVDQVVRGGHCNCREPDYQTNSSTGGSPMAS